MTTSSLKLVSIAAVTLCGISLLTGCAGFGGASFPATSGSEARTSLGTIQGNDYGGHAPLTGAHIYVLQPGTTGYGSQATSLLTGSSSTCNGSANQVCQNTSDTGVPTSWYYMQTDTNGAYNITGDYSCTAGQPVYLYGYQGSPTYPSGNSVFTANQVVVSNLQGVVGAGATGTYTITTTTNQNFYIGETVVGSGFTGQFTGLNTALTVTATNLTTTTFAVTAAQVLGSLAGTYATTGTITAQPGNNASAVNLAVLGVCPSSGNFSTGGTLYNGSTFSPLKFVYMNEVSTIAAAYALEGFTAPTTAHNNATWIGSSSTNLVGIENAALVAGQLYDIQGGQLSTTYAGEGHIARATTAAANGNVPQATLDTLGNILAACVDSNNTTLTPSAQCTTLFNTATTNGIPVGSTGVGVVPLDTAQAAINIARNPGGASATSTTFVNTLYTLPTGNVPFTPNLTSTGAGQPNDFTIAIQYPQSLNAQANNAESIAIDGNGNVWMNTAALKEIFEFSPIGVLKYNTPAQTYSYGYVSVDGNNNIWSGNNFTTSSETEIVTSGTTPTITTFPILTGGIYDAYMTVGSSNGNVYVGGTPSSGTGYQTQWQTNAITATGAAITNFPATLGLGTNYNIAHGAIENTSVGGSGDIWWTTENKYGITRFSPTTGAVATGFPITFTTGAPEMPGIDASGNMWVALQQANVIDKVSPAGVVTAVTGGTINTPFGVTVDGAGNVFVAQRGSTSVIEYNNSGTLISPTTNYSLAGQISKPLNVVTDQSGNIWLTSYDSSQIVQWVGAATPLTNPLAAASGLNKVGATP